MGLNTDYVVASGLQELFVDKITGAPLAGGIVTFYKDQARTILKPIYELTGSAPNYTYQALPNPLTLSSAGTIQNAILGTDVVPYYFPYDTAGNLELYYIKVENSLGGLEFTRQAWPNIGLSVATSDNVTNYIKNGQFLYFNTNIFPNLLIDVSSNLTYSFSGDVTSGRANSWVYSKSNTTAKDTLQLISFPQNLSVEGSPRYYLDINCTQAGSGESIKRFYYMEPNARYLENSQVMISFQLKSSTASTVYVYIERGFGNGGSPTEILLVGSATLTQSFEKYSFSYTIPSTAGKTFGSYEDYFLIYLSFPINHTFNVGIVNAQLNLGNKILQFLPEILSDSKNKQKTDVMTFPDPYSYKNPYEYIRMAMSCDLNLSTGLFNYTPLDPVPIGGTIPAFGDARNPTYNNYMGYLGYTLTDGKILNKGFYRRYFNLIGQMYGAEGDTRSSVGGNVVDITNVYNGATANASDINTGFTISTLQAGTPSVPQITRVICNAASTFPNCAMFRFTPTHYGADFAIVFIKNYEWALPATPSGVGQFVPVYIPGTASAGDVATALGEVFNYLTCQVPNTQGYFLRSVANGSSVDPDRTTRLARPDGVVGDNVGTTQNFQIQSHDHPYLDGQWTSPGGEGPAGGSRSNQDVPRTTTAVGGNQTNPNNINAFVYIKIV